MKKMIIIATCASLLVSSCGTGTHAESGAYTGTMLGGILGSAIGGLAGGPRTSDLGTVVGMVGGAIIGGAMGEAADRQEQQEMREHREAVKRRRAMEQQQQNRHQEDDGVYGSGFDESNSGDDTLYDFDSADYTGDYSTQKPQEMMPTSSSMNEMATNDGLHFTPVIQISNVRFVDDNLDGVINAGEVSKLIFEVRNNSSRPITDIQPMVVETTGNKHIMISPSLHVEQIAPHRGIRYTAMIQADRRLKNGEVKLCASVIQGGHAISKVNEFVIPTMKMKKK